MSNNMLKLTIEDVFNQSVLKTDFSAQQMAQLNRYYQWCQSTSTYKKWMNKHTLWQLKTKIAVLEAIDVINSNTDFFIAIANVMRSYNDSYSVEQIANYLIYYYWENTLMGYQYEDIITDCFRLVFGEAAVNNNADLDKMGIDIQLSNNSNEAIANIQIKNVSFLNNLDYKTDKLKQYANNGVKMLFYSVDEDGFLTIAQTTNGYCLITPQQLLSNNCYEVVGQLYGGRKLSLIELRDILTEQKNKMS